MEVKHLTMDELAAGLDGIRQSPADHGRLHLIVRRPATGERELLEEGVLDPVTGLVGDNWPTRGMSVTPRRVPNPDAQLTLMNSRVAQLVAGHRARWALAGDQLYVDLDLGLTSLPPGTQLAIGSAVIEITAEPHTGCRKFVDRFGADAMSFVNSPEGRAFCLRGVNSKVVSAGQIRVGDTISKR